SIDKRSNSQDDERGMVAVLAEGAGHHGTTEEVLMRYGLHVNSGAAVTDPAVLREVGQLAEELGYDSVLIGDHVIPPRPITTPFPLKLEHPPWHVYQEQD